MNYSEITPYIKELAALSDTSNHIVPDMYAQHDVKRGLRDLNGNGVVAGLTEVSHIKAKEIDAEGNAIPCAGQLYYRGVNVRNLVKGFVSDKRPGFEGTVYLLLFSKLPTKDELDAFCEQLSIEKGLHEEFELYQTVEKMAPEIIAEKRKMYKGVSANVDFYSGMVYKMLGLPYELFTPIFAIARIAGWSAHRMEEIQNAGKIIRPAYINVKEETEYVSLKDR